MYAYGRVAHRRVSDDVVAVMIRFLYNVLNLTESSVVDYIMVAF